MPVQERPCPTAVVDFAKARLSRLAASHGTWQRSGGVALCYPHRDFLVGGTRRGRTAGRLVAQENGWRFLIASADAVVAAMTVQTTDTEWHASLHEGTWAADTVPALGLAIAKLRAAPQTFEPAFIYLRAQHRAALWLRGADRDHGFMVSLPHRSENRIGFVWSTEREVLDAESTAVARAPTARFAVAPVVRGSPGPARG
jgi:hypothetical protein